MNKAEIERLIRMEGIYRWEIAKAIGIHETSLSRWFRGELTESQMLAILSAIEKIKLERMGAK